LGLWMYLSPASHKILRIGCIHSLLTIGEGEMDPVVDDRQKDSVPQIWTKLS
jgi:hypothetical protein